MSDDATSGNVAEGTTELYDSERHRRMRPPDVDRASIDGFPEWLDNRRYRLETRLGSGGMGIVYGYRDPLLDRLVAVKSIPREWSSVEEWRQRFLREARVLAQLSHPNIAHVHHLAREQGLDYLICEFIPGRTLSRILSAGALPYERAIRICVQVGHAIIASHAVHIIHRDVKPGNIMVTPHDVAKLLDFGLARHIGGGGLDDPSLTGSDASTTRSRGAPDQRRVLGTPGYMSPEQATGQTSVDHRTDIWSFGCILFECLSGERVFPGRSREARIRATLEDEPDWLALPEDLPDEAHDVLRRCLIKDPAERLADLDEACHVLMATLEQRASPGSGPPVPHNLPAPLTSYVPRPGEVARLTDLLEANRLVTLTGPGGCGKTRLATVMAQSIVTPGNAAAMMFPDGVWLVELTSLASSQLVPEAVASALRGRRRTPPPPGQTTIDALLADLEDSATLIVLDNCETVSDGCLEFVVRVLSRCPRVRFVAASRERLHAPGEQVYAVPPLSYPQTGSIRGADDYEAVTLFGARARLVQPDFVLDADTAATVADICRRLEGLPLAIELAAARLASLSVADVATRLIDVLGSDRVLDASIRSSVEMLEADERRLLGRLAIFAGGWTLEAAEAVCGNDDACAADERPVIDLLSRLVDRSLVRYDVRGSRARYHLLETVREHCRRHVDPDPGPGLARRHLACYLELARKMDEAFVRKTDDDDEASREGHVFTENPQPAWLDRLDTEHDNLRNALDHCRSASIEPEIFLALAKAMSEFWRIRGHLGEGRHWLDRALEAAVDADATLRIRALNAAATIASLQGDFAAARARYDAALDLARGEGDRQREAGILSNTGLLCQMMGDLDDAETFHERAMEGYRVLGDERGMSQVGLNRAVVLKLRGRYAEAEAVLRECLPLFEKHKDRQRIAATLRNLGELARHRDAADEATDLFRRSLRVTVELKDRLGMARLLRWIGLGAHEAGDHERAVRLLAAAATMKDAVEAVDTASEDGDALQTLATLEAILGKDRMDALWNEGATLDEAAILRLADPDGPEHDSPPGSRQA